MYLEQTDSDLDYEQCTTHSYTFTQLKDWKMDTLVQELHGTE